MKRRRDDQGRFGASSAIGAALAAQYDAAKRLAALREFCDLYERRKSLAGVARALRVSERTVARWLAENADLREAFEATRRSVARGNADALQWRLRNGS